MAAILDTIVPSKIRRELVVELFGKGRHASISELARDLALPYGAAHRELAALYKGGLVSKKKRGKESVFGPRLRGADAAALRRLAQATLAARGYRDPLDGREIGAMLRRKAAVLAFAKKLQVGVAEQQ